MTKKHLYHPSPKTKNFQKNYPFYKKWSLGISWVVLGHQETPAFINLLKAASFGRHFLTETPGCPDRHREAEETGGSCEYGACPRHKKASICGQICVNLTNACTECIYFICQIFKTCKGSQNLVGSKKTCRCAAAFGFAESCGRDPLKFPSPQHNWRSWAWQAGLHQL